MSTQNDKVRVVVIGLGAQNLNDHIPALLRRNDIELVGVYDPSVDAVSKFWEKYPYLKKVPVIEDLKNLVGVDAAIVAVPHAEYGGIVKLLCDKKIKVFKEKPLARDLEEAQAFINIPGFEDLCFICTQRRFNSLYRRAEKRLKEIGNVYMFNAEYKLNIKNPDEGWRGNTDLAGGGCVLDMGYHIVDQLMWWFGMPQNIFAATSSKAVDSVNNYAEDSATIAFKYINGMHGSILLARSAGEKAEKYIVYGSKGYILGNKKSLIIKNKLGEVIEEEKLENDEEMLDAQLDFFVNSVKSGTSFKDVLSRNMLNMEFINKCYQNVGI